MSTNVKEKMFVIYVMGNRLKSNLVLRIMFDKSINAHSTYTFNVIIIY